MINSEKLICTTGYLTLYMRCCISLPCYKRVRLCVCVRVHARVYVRACVYIYIYASISYMSDTNLSSLHPPFSQPYTKMLR